MLGNSQGILTLFCMQFLHTAWMMMGGLSAQQSQKWSFYLMSKYQILTLMTVMTLMGRMRTFLTKKMLQLQMFLRKVQQVQPQYNPHNSLQQCSPDFVAL